MSMTSKLRPEKKIVYSNSARCYKTNVKLCRYFVSVINQLVRFKNGNITLV